MEIADPALSTEKFSCEITGCNSEFERVVDRWDLADERVIDDDYIDYVFGDKVLDSDTALALREKAFEGPSYGDVVSYRMVGKDKNIYCQDITLYIPPEIFDEDMEYVCVKQFPNRAIAIVKEEDLKPGDTAVRVFIPHKYFQRQLIIQKGCALCDAIYDEMPYVEKTMKDVMYLHIHHYVGIGLFAASA